MKVKAPPRAAGVVVFRRTPRGVRLLVLRAYNNWDFPKGLVESGEDMLSAAKREVKEETGLTETEEHDIELPISTALGRPEHHEFRWITLDEADDLLPPRLAVVLEWV